MASEFEIIVISMISKEDRRRTVRENLSRMTGPSWRFFDAVNDAAVVEGLDSDPDRQIARYGRTLGRAEVGCFKSHYLVLREFVKSGTSDWIMVMEDDVILDVNFNFQEVIEFCEKNNYNYIRLFAKMYKPARIIAMLSQFRQVIRFSTDPYGAQCYLISKAGAAAVLNSIETIELPIDDEFGRFWRHGQLPLSVFPFPAIETSVPSSLSQDRESGDERRIGRSIDLVMFRLKEKLRKELYNLRH